MADFGKKIKKFFDTHMHFHQWVMKHTCRLFFMDKLRKSVTFYEQCEICGTIKICEDDD